ncbi:MAG: BlaI/MecI/CopY family transcriptional regulator [Bacilli bacterium]|jgi:predicted transcriptional regulator|nr:BlaI/MecI/CopY family transcriptional regulator [Bacilli bacterium]
MKHKKLTQSQLSIMKTLWAENKAMIASDFVQLDPSLNLNSVQSSLRSLLKKNYIEVSDIVYSGKVLTRSYVPTISADEYATENINGIVNDLLSSNILLHYVETENDIETIKQLQQKLEERKKFLERNS